MSNETSSTAEVILRFLVRGGRGLFFGLGVANIIRTFSNISVNLLRLSKGSRVQKYTTKKVGSEPSVYFFF